MARKKTKELYIMGILKIIGQLLTGVLIAILVLVLGMVFLAAAPENLRLFVGLLLIVIWIMLANLLWKHYRLMFWGGILFAVLLCIVFPVFIVVFSKANDIKTRPTELTKNEANFNYTNLNFSGVWTASFPENTMFDFAHPAYLGRLEIAVNGKSFRYISEERYSEKDPWEKKFTVIYDGENIYRDPDPLANSEVIAPWFKDPQYWRDVWEFHPKGSILRTTDIKTIAGREAVKFETKSLLGSKKIYWVDSATGVVLKKENGYECQEINYAPVDQGIFKGSK